MSEPASTTTRTRRPRLELTASQKEKVVKGINDGKTFSKIAAELQPSKVDTDDWQPLYDAVRRVAIDSFGSIDAVKEARKTGREAAAASA